MTMSFPQDKTIAPEYSGSRAAARLRFYPVWLSLGLLMVALIIYLSLAPLKPIKVVEFPFRDKVAHFVAYFATTFWLGQIFRKRSTSSAIALALTALGVILEFIQGTTDYRTIDVLDMAANAVGVAAGLFLAWTRLGNTLFVLENALNGFTGRDSPPENRPSGS